MDDQYLIFHSLSTYIGCADPPGAHMIISLELSRPSFFRLRKQKKRWDGWVWGYYNW
jgi:hypothetical protein